MIGQRNDPERTTGSSRCNRDGNGGRLLATLERPAGEQVRIALDDYPASRFVSLRLYWQPDGEQEYKPTKKGVTLKAHELAEAIAALQMAAKELDEEEQGE